MNEQESQRIMGKLGLGLSNRKILEIASESRLIPSKYQ